MKLVFIHGRAQEGKDPVKLQEEWEDALNKGLQAAGLTWPAGLTVAFPFYGDKLDQLVKQLDTPTVDDVVTKGAAQDTTEASFRGQLLREMATAAGITDADIQKHYTGTPQEKGPLNWKWVHAILRALDKTPLGESAIDRFTRDVYVYLAYPAVRKAIDAIVADALTGGADVVVGHSLGSVVGFNVLRKAPATLGVRRYVTVGSPLAVKAIKADLDTPLAMPGCVNSWYNAMDPRDVVALYPLDGNHFPIDPAIENKTTVDNFTENRHSIAGYLTDPDVARKIHEALA